MKTLIIIFFFLCCESASFCQPTQSVVVKRTPAQIDSVLKSWGLPMLERGGKSLRTDGVLTMIGVGLAVASLIPKDIDTKKGLGYAAGGCMFLGVCFRIDAGIRFQRASLLLRGKQ